MSRSGYSDDLDQWPLIMWRGAVTSAIRGKRGQQFLRRLIAAFDAMPEKRLISGNLRTSGGDVCALGCLGRAEGVALERLDSYEHEQLAATFAIAPALVREVEYENDECYAFTGGKASPEERWESVPRAEREGPHDTLRH